MTTEIQSIRRLTDNEECAAARAKLADLQQKKRAIEQERGTLAATKQEGNGIEAAAAALRRGETMRDSLDTSERAANLERLGREWRILCEAVRQQEIEVGEIESRVSREIAEEVEPEYRVRLKEQLSAMLTLSEAGGAVSDLLTDLADGGVRSSGVLRPMPYGRLGRIEDANSYLRQWIFECQREKVLSDVELDEAGVPAAIISEHRRRIDNTRAEDVARREAEQNPQPKQGSKRWSVMKGV